MASLAAVEHALTDCHDIGEQHTQAMNRFLHEHSRLVVQCQGVMPEMAQAWKSSDTQIQCSVTALQGQMKIMLEAASASLLMMKSALREAARLKLVDSERHNASAACGLLHKVPQVPHSTSLTLPRPQPSRDANPNPQTAGARIVACAGLPTVARLCSVSQEVRGWASDALQQATVLTCRETQDDTVSHIDADAALRWVCQQPGALKRCATADLGWCGQLTELGLEYLGLAVPGLTELRMPECEQIGDRGLEAHAGPET